MTSREQEILHLIQNNPMISQQEIGDILNISRSSVGVHITNLSKKGHIKGRGYILSNDKYISVIGGANVDIIGSPENTLVDFNSNPGQISISCGGVGRNIAENLAKLHVDTRLISAIGSDNHGYLIKDNANKSNIDISASLFLDDYRTASYLAILDENQNMKVAISDMEIVETLTPSLMNRNIKFIQDSKITILDTNLSEETLEYLLNNISQTYFIDAVSSIKAKKLKGLLHQIHTLKVNRYEAEILSEVKITDSDSILRAGRALLDAGIDRVVLTLGEDGLYYFSSEEIYKVTSTVISAENNTGAGDALIAGMAYSYFNGFSIEESLYFSVGASRVTIKDISSISEDLSIENIKKEKGDITICQI